MVADDLEERFGCVGVELLPGVLVEFLKRRLDSDSPAVGTVGGHGMEGVAGEDDAAGEGYTLPREVVGVALAVPALVLGSIIGARWARLSIAATIRSPINGCCRINSHSLFSSGPGLFKTESGTPILPTSCKSAASRSR